MKEFFVDIDLPLTDRVNYGCLSILVYPWIMGDWGIWFGLVWAKMTLGECNTFVT